MLVNLAADYRGSYNRYYSKHPERSTLFINAKRLVDSEEAVKTRFSFRRRQGVYSCLHLFQLEPSLVEPAFAELGEEVGVDEAVKQLGFLFELECSDQAHDDVGAWCQSVAVHQGPERGILLPR